MKKLRYPSTSPSEDVAGKKKTLRLCVVALKKPNWNYKWMEKLRYPSTSHSEDIAEKKKKLCAFASLRFKNQIEIINK